MSIKVNAALKTVKMRAIIFWLVIVGNRVLYAGMPLLTPGRHLMEDDQILLGLRPMPKLRDRLHSFIVWSLPHC
uniref:Odorant receptors 38.3 n=1 Tax=Lobesia botrana TaxID=209534 RepID=A0A345BEW2_9NEOP|nr:odorant receptors 38.3 [Lobesia botrana]